MKKIIIQILIGLGILGAGVLIQFFFSDKYPECLFKKHEVPTVRGIDEDVSYVSDPKRVIEILEKINISEEDLNNLIPTVQIDGPVQRQLTAENDIEAFFLENILLGKQPSLGGVLNEQEIQEIYRSIAEKKGILTVDNMDADGTINVYDEIRTNENIVTNPGTDLYTQD